MQEYSPSGHDGITLATYFVLLDAHFQQLKLPGSFAHACHFGPVSTAQVPSDGLPDLWRETGVVRHL